MWGSDQMASVEPAGLIKLVKGIRDLEKSFGDGGPRNIYYGERENESTQRMSKLFIKK